MNGPSASPQQYFKERSKPHYRTCCEPALNPSVLRCIMNCMHEENFFYVLYFNERTTGMNGASEIISLRELREADAEKAHDNNISLFLTGTMCQINKTRIH